jgi:hypothetical protein
MITTIITMLRYPTDDGSCQRYNTKNSCLNRQTAFDYYCDWTDDACQFRNPKITMTAIIILGWLQFIISAPLKLGINFIFDNILCSATHTMVEDQIKESRPNLRDHVRRMSLSISQNLRRMSNQIQSNIHLFNKRLSRTMRSTITVDSDFMKMRNSVIDILHKPDTNSTVDDNNEYATNHDIHETDANQIIEEDCIKFVRSYVKYRNNLDDTVAFDKAWAFLNCDNNHDDNDRTSFNVIPSFSSIDYDVHDKRYASFIQVIYSEIRKVHVDVTKIIGSNDIILIINYSIIITLL